MFNIFKKMKALLYDKKLTPKEMCNGHKHYFASGASRKCGKSCSVYLNSIK